VIDMADQTISRHLDDHRLSVIEEIILLGFAYGGCHLTSEFCHALFNSRSLVNVRTLSFHSIESGEELSRRFWASPMARHLEQVSEVPYFGETIAGKSAPSEPSPPRTRTGGPSAGWSATRSSVTASTSGSARSGWPILKAGEGNRRVGLAFEPGKGRERRYNRSRKVGWWYVSVDVRRPHSHAR
jgi:hypothetical protein